MNAPASWTAVVIYRLGVTRRHGWRSLNAVPPLSKALLAWETLVGDFPDEQVFPWAEALSGARRRHRTAAVQDAAAIIGAPSVTGKAQNADDKSATFTWESQTRSGKSRPRALSALVPNLKIGNEI